MSAAATETDAKAAAAAPKILSRPMIELKGWGSAAAATTAGGAATPFSFSIVQWNMLADYLAEPKSFPHTEPALLKWSYRSGMLLSGLKELNADLVCLEEADHFTDFFEPAFRELGFSGVFKKKTDPDAKDGCAFFYRTSKFALAATSGIAIREGESQVAILNRLHPIVNSKPDTSVDLYVVVTHYKAKHGFEAKRLQQSIALSEHVTKFIAAHHAERKATPPPFEAKQKIDTSAKGVALPAPAVDLSKINLIIAGDFNEEWPLPPIQYLATDFLAAFAGATPSPSANPQPQAWNQPTATTASTATAVAAPPAASSAMTAALAAGHKYTDAEGMILHKFDVEGVNGRWTNAHPFRLRSLYETGHPVPFWTTAKHRAVTVKRTIDYIWYSSERIVPTRLLQLPTEADLPKLMPASNYPSDHVSLYGCFQLL